MANPARRHDKAAMMVLSIVPRGAAEFLFRNMPGDGLATWEEGNYCGMVYGGSIVGFR